MTTTTIKTSLALLAAALVLAVYAGPSAAQEAPKSFEDVVRSVVGVRAHVPPDARTARSLGPERQGNGVVIDGDGLVLTIGYVILEADHVEVITPDGEVVAARVVGYDHSTGFGLLRAARPLGLSPARFGDSSSLKPGDSALAVSLAGNPPATMTRVASRRAFAGYWEYLLEDAIFTLPPHPNFGGAGLFGGDGRLLGIGSLIVGDALEDVFPSPGNMFVPIDALKPILDDLISMGRPSRPSHPWLGIYAGEVQGRLLVRRTAAGGPADRAGIQAGDIIFGVGGKSVRGLADFFRKVWGKGDAGTVVSIDVLAQGSSDMTINNIEVRSMDRYDWLKLK
ncbi:MAG: S1C family serine protease [Rhodospirillales bacterium]